jgi:hypothetical protein
MYDGINPKKPLDNLNKSEHFSIIGWSEKRWYDGFSYDQYSKPYLKNLAWDHLSETVKGSHKSPTQDTFPLLDITRYKFKGIAQNVGITTFQKILIDIKR